MKMITILGHDCTLIIDKIIAVEVVEKTLSVHTTDGSRFDFKYENSNRAKEEMIRVVQLLDRL